MAGCGYVCPQCEGRGFTEDGNPCDWCAAPTVSTSTTDQVMITNEQWLKEVHEGKCCSDE